MAKKKEQKPLATPTQCRAIEMLSTGDERCQKDAYGDFCMSHQDYTSDGSGNPHPGYEHWQAFCPNCGY